VALPIPSPVGKWKKILIAVKDTVVSGVTYLAYEFVGEMDAAGSDPDDPNASTWRRFVYTFEDTTSNDPADNQQVSFEIVNMTGGSVDGSWTDADYNGCHVYLHQIFTTLAATFASRYHLTKVEAYVRAFNAYGGTYTPGVYYKHFADSGAPAWMANLNTPMAGDGRAAAQACSSFTERTPSRRHWGRTYLPTLGIGAYDTNGRVRGPAVDAIASAVHLAYDTLMANDWIPVVVTTMANRVPTHALQGVTAISVDDVPDVIRRRRLKNNVHVAVAPLALAKPAEDDA